MDLTLSDEHLELAAAVRSFVNANLITEDTSAPSDQQWRAAADQGWLAIGIPEDAGGFGGTLADEVQVFGELGAHCAHGGFLAALIASRMSALEGDDVTFEAIAGGSMRVALAFADARAQDSLVALDTESATCLLYVDEDEPRIALYGRQSWSIQRTLDPVDPATTAAEVAITAEPLITVSGDAAEELITRAAVLTAAALAGIADAATGMSVDYAKVRMQFGRPIGSFQAVSHRCADMAMRAASAIAATRFAAVSVDEGHPDASRRAAAARRAAERAAIENARASIQIHGAIGFTWEHRAHRLIKYAHRLASGFQVEQLQRVRLVRATAADKEPALLLD
ncbi:acyl-CoA dehydrogenase family protein [Microbacterium sp. NPDC055357]